MQDLSEQDPLESRGLSPPVASLADVSKVTRFGDGRFHQGHGQAVGILEIGVTPFPVCARPAPPAS
jgi:hypothetical protein